MVSPQSPLQTFSTRKILGSKGHNRLTKPHSSLSVRAIDPMNGWRGDALYDLPVTIGFNDDPPVAGISSAIFLHIAGPGFAPTEGGVALFRSTLVELLAECGPGDRLCINPPQEAENQH